ncbi:MAG: helix-turn-helix domain-containing protein [Eubacterium sp.]|nr:helix-turn-helix domain-containing protein [Eubacterium sp.]
MQQKQKIILMHLKDVSNRKITRQLHKSNDTVNSYVREYEDNRKAL